MVVDTLFLRCKKCDGVSHYTVKFIEGMIRGVKQTKVLEVAQQMHDKRGPFYDKWKAAMDLRGEQMRCSDCMSHIVAQLTYPDNYCIYKLKVVNPSWYACKNITYYQG